MQHFSTLPYLCAMLFLFWIWRLGSAAMRGELSGREFIATSAWLVTVSVWGIFAGLKVYQGAFSDSAFLRLLPALWMPTVPVMLTLLFAAFGSFRGAMAKLFSTHGRSFALMQCLRLAAIGGVYKGFAGLLPPSFALTVGIPDFLFALCGLAVALKWRAWSQNPRALVAWNITGFAVILPSLPLLQMGLPGPFYAFDSLPDARTIFAFPLGLAPVWLVPMFMAMNAAHAATLLRGLRGAPVAQGDIIPSVESAY